EVGTGPLPGAKNPESWHSQYGSKFARNVTVATLTPFLPDPARASGAAKETTSTDWFEAFVRRMGMHSMLKPVASSGSGGAANQDATRLCLILHN
ncbi:MAG TPA: hypothetical protein VJU82_01700, partial [Acidobacteriaceae bacterium]|nr:hypothetical protein [Acidobacteriaceae bacterium]